jgi:uncharacterized protein with FMN-binding domain
MFTVYTHNMNTNKTPLLIGLIIVVIALVGGAFWYLSGKKAPTDIKIEIPLATRGYKDGTYTSIGTYTVPSGPEEIGVTITLANDIVTSASLELLGKAPPSKLLQGKFQEGFKELVVGKNINEITLTVVNGSSLTPKGFVDALSKIKTEASI